MSPPEGAGGEAQCPVDEKSRRAWVEAARAAQGARAPASPLPSPPPPSQLPPQQQQATHGADEVNPDNNMPAVPQQQPWPGQVLPLDTNRVASSIPKGSKENLPAHQRGAEEQEVWVYPSQQQFFNAMKRKGWHDAREEDVGVIVQIHNAVNERSWREVLRWEAMHACECPQGPKLLRFLGRPTELSPKARMMGWIGYTRPFDRHDWTIDRCGKQVRYIVDFYQGRSSAAGTGAGTSAPPVAVMHVDARPALDSFDALVDRLKMALLPSSMTSAPASCPPSSAASSS